TLPFLLLYCLKNSGFSLIIFLRIKNEETIRKIIKKTNKGAKMINDNIAIAIRVSEVKICFTLLFIALLYII
nr:hypothetical protein [Bacillus paranthracis]